MAVDKHARFTALRQQAAQVLADGGTSLDAGSLNTTDLARLMEELCIYHEELKIQNDELAITHTRADSARAHYRTLFNLLPLPVMLVDAQGAVVEDNDVSQDWLGPSRRFHHQDMRLTQALDRADRPRVLRLLQSLEPTRKGQLGDIRLTRFDQTDRQVDVHVARLPADFHHEARYALVLLDRSIEAARLAEQGLFNALLDSSDDFIYATDLHGRLMLANAGFLGVLGVARDRALGRKLADFWPLHNLTELQAHEAEVRSRGQALNFTETLQWRFDNPSQTWAVRKFPIRGRRGDTVGVASVCRDITAEQHAARTSHLAVHAFAALPVPVALTCADGKVQRMNGALERLSGLAEESLAGRALHALLDGQRTPLPMAGVHEHVLEHGQWTELLHVRHINGRSTPVHAHVSRVKPTPESEPLLMWVLAGAPQGWEVPDSSEPSDAI
jgi:PAS domain S-box-containing protein